MQPVCLGLLVSNRDFQLAREPNHHHSEGIQVINVASPLPIEDSVFLLNFDDPFRSVFDNWQTGPGETLDRVSVPLGHHLLSRS